MLGKNLIQAAAGNAAGEQLYVEDVFSTWLWTGTGSTEVINNGIDLAGEGGLVWVKNRLTTANNQLQTSPAARLVSNNTDAEAATFSNFVTSFNSNGFTAGSGHINSGEIYTSWTFRKAPGFFDVVTYTGTGSLSTTISHNLGVVPAVIIAKRTDTTGNWGVSYLRGDIGSGGIIGFSLNLTDSQRDTSNSVGSAFTSTTFKPAYIASSTSSVSDYNANGGTYVAYLFAHDEQIFGESGDQSVIKCGSYTGNGSSSGPVINLGWEPQWLLIKRTNSTGDWQLIDNMRGFTVGGADAELNPNLSAAESSGTFVTPLSNGFQLNTTDTGYNANGGTYIYIAIRRGPMKTPTDATEVFKPDYVRGTDTSIFAYLGHPADATILGYRNGDATSARFRSRLTGASYLTTSSTAAETTSTVQAWDNMLGYLTTSGSVDTNFINWTFRRAPGFFDVVAYTGDGSGNLVVNHNLGVTPELWIIRGTNRTSRWFTGCPGVFSGRVYLNSDSAEEPGPIIGSFTSTTFRQTTGVGEVVGPNIVYLFASCPGVSKVGNYTGTGTTLNIDCGFTAGARFVLIKRTDSTGDWYVWDTARGIVSGNDPYLLLNSTAAEVTTTDYIDPLSSGFQISSTAPAGINASGGSYIFLAIA